MRWRLVPAAPGRSVARLPDLDIHPDRPDLISHRRGVSVDLRVVEHPDHFHESWQDRFPRPGNLGLGLRQEHERISTTACWNRSDNGNKWMNAPRGKRLPRFFGSGSPVRSITRQDRYTPQGRCLPETVFCVVGLGFAYGRPSSPAGRLFGCPAGCEWDGNRPMEQAFLNLQRAGRLGKARWLSSGIWWFIHLKERAMQLVRACAGVVIRSAGGRRWGRDRS